MEVKECYYCLGMRRPGLMGVLALNTGLGDSSADALAAATTRRVAESAVGPSCLGPCGGTAIAPSASGSEAGRMRAMGSAKRRRATVEEAR